MGTKSVIGDHSVMFMKRSEFLYKALGQMDCMAIRKSKYQEVQDKFGAFTQKLKVKVFNRYKDLIRKPVLEHKHETVMQIQRINKYDYGQFSLVDKSNDDERTLKKEMEKFGGEGQAQLMRVKKLEEKVD